MVGKYFAIKSQRLEKGKNEYCHVFRPIGGWLEGFISLHVCHERGIDAAHQFFYDPDTCTEITKAAFDEALLKEIRRIVQFEQVG